MEEEIIEEEIIREIGISRYEAAMREDEKSRATIEKYLHHVRQFTAFCAGRKIDKEIMRKYKEKLGESYAPSSANTALAAVNGYLRFCGLGRCCVRHFKVQRKVYCPEEKELNREEYIRLVDAARRKGRGRLAMLIQVVCSTGIRISELKYITVEAVRQGETCVSCKGKMRTVFLTHALREQMREYISQRGIETGPVFITRTGKPVDRTNIWREMKALCTEAAVSPGKVFPHSLRHLFARCFYAIDRDIAKLADILGHSSINTTRIYIATTGEEHRRRMEAMHLVI